MAYQKLSADYLFTGYQILKGDYVLITSKEGKVIDIVTAQQAGDDIRKLEGMLCPGFVNAHCHLELSHMKGIIPKGLGMPGFIQNIIANRFQPREQVLRSIMEGEQEMIRNGIVAVGDISNTTDTIGCKVGGRMFYRNFIETFGTDVSGAGQKFRVAEEVLKAFEDAAAGPSSIVPHAPYSLSDVLFEMISRKSAGKIISYHNQESPEENELLEKGTGVFKELYDNMKMQVTNLTLKHKRSLEAVLPYISIAEKVILVHNVATNAGDLELLDIYGRKKFHFCICANANLYITGGLPDIKMLKDYSEQIVIGTDSLASNDSLSVLDELKTISANFEWIELSDLLKWATVNGSRALGIDGKYGSFGKGKQPGIILIRGFDDEMSLKEAFVELV
ncbi:MAG: amidohydrolase family protein [Flavitalea sp.]